MINITPAALAQIKKAEKQYQGEDLHLRVAAKQHENGAIEYGMGYDQLRDKDQIFSISGVEVLISRSSADLIRGATLDYIEVEGGDSQFAFINPNDAAHRPPEGMEYLFEKEQPEH